MKKSISFLTTLFLMFSITVSAQNKGFKENIQKKNISKVLDDLNEFATKADFKKYFDLYAEESIYIGTDATEIWDKKQFMDYAKPHFDKGQGWSFKSLKRNIYFSKDGNYAWFDELLDTQMKLCRGSGVLEKTAKGWKIKQYILSMTIPNDNADEVIKAKSSIEDKLISELSNK